MSKQFTPGPWELRGASPNLDRDIWAGETNIAYAFKAGPGISETDDTHYPALNESFANARLIAAAPDLYEACKKANNWIHIIIEDFPFKNPENKEALERLAKSLEQTLAKADAKQ